MTKRHLCLAVVALATGLVGAGDERRDRRAGDKPAPDGRKADRQAIRKATQELARAFAKGDARAMGARCR